MKIKNHSSIFVALTMAWLQSYSNVLFTYQQQNLQKW
jgi:hypothetical protein